MKAIGTNRFFSLQVVYDISQLPRESLLPLRDSLLQSLTQYTDPSAPTGSRAITTQLCLALADLAYQLPEWKDVIAGMVDTFGQRVESVEMLLEFLKVLVEEAGNPRIPLSVSICQALLVAISDQRNGVSVSRSCRSVFRVIVGTKGEGSGLAGNVPERPR